MKIWLIAQIFAVACNCSFVSGDNTDILDVDDKLNQVITTLSSLNPAEDTTTKLFGIETSFVTQANSFRVAIDDQNRDFLQTLINHSEGHMPTKLLDNLQEGLKPLDIEKSLKETAILMFMTAASDTSFNEKWATLQSVKKTKDVLARIRNDAKTGLSEDDFRCIGLSLGIQMGDCDSKDVDYFPMLSFWRLVRCLYAFLVTPREMDGRAFAFGLMLFQDAEPEVWSHLATIPYYRKQANDLLHYMKTEHLDYIYDRSTTQYENLFFGNITDMETRKEMSLNLREVLPSKAVAIIREADGLGDRYHQKLLEFIDRKETRIVSTCAGLGVESRGISDKAMTMFSNDHLPQAEQVVYALGSHSKVPSNVSEYLRDKIISGSLDSKFSDCIIRYCHVLADQTDLQEMETSWQTCKTPEERSGSIVLHMLYALIPKVELHTRKKFLKKIDPGLEYLRKIVAEFKGVAGVKDEDVDYVLSSLSPKETNNSTNYVRVWTILRPLMPEIENMTDAAFNSRLPEDYNLRKIQMRRTGRRIKTFHTNKQIELKEDAQGLAEDMIASCKWPVGDYKKIQALESLADEFANKAAGRMQTLYEKAASTASEYAEVTARMADEFNTLDCIWNSVRSNRKKMKPVEWLQAFIMSTTSGTTNHVLKEYFRRHNERVETFLKELERTKFEHLGYWLRDAIGVETSINWAKLDWVDIGNRLKNRYKKMINPEKTSSHGR